jgi:hypothetical protein
MVKMLFHHVQKTQSKTSGGGEGAKKGFQKTVIFLLFYSGLVFAASAGRVRGSFVVDPSSEGKIGISEYAGAVIPVCVVGIFGLSKWFNPFSKAKGKNEIYESARSQETASNKSTHTSNKSASEKTVVYHFRTSQFYYMLFNVAKFISSLPPQ